LTEDDSGGSVECVLGVVKDLIAREARVAVDLYHPPLVAPEEVHLVAVQARVDLRRRKAAAEYKRQEALLELVAGDGRGALLPRR